MSLYGLMRTSVSGMGAQAQRLATVADNVANVNTTGYKSVSCEFSSLLLATCPGSYDSGSVLTDVRNHVAMQGSLLNTSSVTDLAISGQGFFIVSDADGTPFLTRSGSFVGNGDGQLYNAAGFTLLGYRLDPSLPDITVNGYTGLEPINLNNISLAASPSTAGSFAANLPAGAPSVAAADLPSLNAASSQYSAKASLVTYDNLGGEVIVDLYFSKISDNQWEAAVYNKADASAGTSFPYGSGPLAVATLNFDPDNGNLLDTSASAVDIPIPGGQTLSLDLADTSQLAADYTVLSASINGNAPSATDAIEIARDGTVYATYSNGARSPVYRIPLAHVASPDMLMAQPGNIYTATAESGDVQVGFAETGSLGKIISSTLEQSTVDLAGELTAMIDAQRSYTANSKVFQTGSELMDVLVNLKR